MSGWESTGANDGWGNNTAVDDTWGNGGSGGEGGFVPDTSVSEPVKNVEAAADFGGDNFGGVGLASDGACRNCGKQGHFARQCEEPKKLTGACFRCGQEGHNKADCTNDPVDRPFTETCHTCSQEGHPASQCPEQICRLCEKSGHRAIDCKEKRKVDYGDIAECENADAAWEEMQKADKAKDMNAFRKAFMAYAKALTSAGESFDLVEVEKTFRQVGMKAHLVAQKKDVPLDFTIVDFQGNPDKSYVLGFQWVDQRRRRFFAEVQPESAEENLERLADCGLIMDRGIPVCGNCKTLGHIRKHCPEESQSTSEAMKCANCGGNHRLRDCTEERVDRHSITCRRCGENGHKAVDCPSEDTRPPKTCRNCGSEDHIAKDCTEPRNPATVQCRNCDEMSHFSKECPKPRDWSKVQCSNCQKFGHTKVRCKEPPAEENGVVHGDNGWGAGDDDAGATVGSGAWEDTPTITTGDSGGW